MQCFRLFDLPPEVRDVIYGFLTIPRKEILVGADDQDTATYTFDAPLVAVLLSSRRLGEEYRQVLPRGRVLLLEGAKCDYWTGYHPVPRSLADVVSDLVVFMHVVCFCDNLDEDEFLDHEGYPCDATIAVGEYARELDSYRNLFPIVERIQVKMCIWRRPDGLNERIREPLEPPQLSHTSGFTTNLKRLVALPGIKGFELVSCISPRDYEDYCKGIRKECRTRIVTWSPAEGWQACGK